MCWCACVCVCVCVCVIDGGTVPRVCCLSHNCLDPLPHPITRTAPHPPLALHHHFPTARHHHPWPQVNRLQCSFWLLLSHPPADPAIRHDPALIQLLKDFRWGGGRAGL